MLLDFRKPPLIELDHFTSSSGLFYCFYGLHYHKGKACYDVGTSNKRTGELVRLHFNEDNNIAPEASAKTKWEELKAKVDAIKHRELPDDPTYLEGVSQWLDINQPNWRKSQPHLKKPS